MAKGARLVRVDELNLVWERPAAPKKEEAHEELSSEEGDLSTDNVVSLDDAREASTPPPSPSAKDVVASAKADAHRLSETELRIVRAARMMRAAGLSEEAIAAFLSQA